jgi:hypothetical protein
VNDFQKSGDAYTGRMTWWGAMAWADQLVYGGYDDWRLPHTLPVNGSSYIYSFAYNGSTDNGFNISAPDTVYSGSTGHEMDYMYYNNLGNLAYYDKNGTPQSGWGLNNSGPFINIQVSDYWTETIYTPTGGQGAVWVFRVPYYSSYNLNDSKTDYHYAWAVRDGDTVPVPQPISIDIKPGSDPNSINPKSRGKIPVAILSTEDWDSLSRIDLNSLTFGRTGDEGSLAFCHGAEDVNNDGLQDLVCHFYTQEAGFQCLDAMGILRGKTVEGTPIEGSDSVKIVPCK